MDFWMWGRSSRCLNEATLFLLDSALAHRIVMRVAAQVDGT